MGIIARGRGTRNTTSPSMARKNFSYNYGGLKLKPGHEFHENIVDKVIDRAIVATAKKDERNDHWDRTDDILTAYVDLDSAEQKLKDRDPSIPVKIAVPYSYAALETILTYMHMAFLSRPPVIQYDSFSSEDTVAVKQLELLVQRQMAYYKAPLALHTWYRDAIGYGIGGIAPVWRSDKRWRTTREAREVQTLNGPQMSNAPRREPYTVFEGTELVPIGPRYLLLDPNAPGHDPQQGAFIGWVEETNQERLLMLEREDPETWFNMRYLYEAGPTRSTLTVTKDFYQDFESLRPTTLIHMYVKLIPKEWGLPAEEGNDGWYPEIWLITVADDWCVVRAERLEASHGRFPIALSAPDYDGYSTYPLSRLEIVEGLQTTLDWLFNSHIANVRKAVNNTLVVDPSLVRVEDLLEARAGGIIRLKETAWGRNPKDAVHQLQINDVTRGHFSDAGQIISLIQQVSGSNDAVMGIMKDRGSRVSAREAGNVASSALSRLEKIGAVIGMQGMTDLGMFFATNTIDYMSDEVSFRVLGDWPDELIAVYGQGGTMRVSPSDIDVPFDLVPRDGSLPLDQNGMIESWLQFFQIIQGNEILLQQYDVGRIFMHIAQMLGAKNVRDFLNQEAPPVGQAIEDQRLLDEVKKGNYVKPEELGDV